jgi:hypothetical protein
VAAGENVDLLGEPAPPLKGVVLAAAGFDPLSDECRRHADR